MGFVIGMDEAGYGPNLGPLVLTATVWEVPGRWPKRTDFWQVFADWPLADRSCSAPLRPLGARRCRQRLARSRSASASGQGPKRRRTTAISKRPVGKKDLPA